MIISRGRADNDGRIQTICEMVGVELTENKMRENELECACQNILHFTKSIPETRIQKHQIRCFSLPDFKKCFGAETWQTQWSQFWGHQEIESEALKLLQSANTQNNDLVMSSKQWRLVYAILKVKDKITLNGNGRGKGSPK